MNYFDFSEALSFIKSDIPVCLTIEGKTREYYMDNDVIMCKVGKTTYAVKQFYIDAIMSNEWYVKSDNQ